MLSQPLLNISVICCRANLCEPVSEHPLTAHPPELCLEPLDPLLDAQDFYSCTFVS